MFYESSHRALLDDLDRWVLQGRMSPRQAARIAALQRRRERQDATRGEQRRDVPATLRR